jgi:predicted Zn finger-like uncharacterized protein
MPELTQCPQCQRKLNVQEEQLGQAVQCPACGATFTAEPAGPAPRPAPPREEPPRRGYAEEPAPRYDRGYDDRGRDYRRGYDDPDYRDPYRRLRPHRGGAVLTLGILSLVGAFCCPLASWIMGGIAIGMGNNDTRAMDAGQMDESGRGSTSSGRVCAIIGIFIASINAAIGILIQLSHLK